MNEKEMIERLNWCHPVIVKYVEENQFDVFRKKTLTESRTLQPQAPTYTQSVNKQNFGLGVFGLSMYRILMREYGFEQAEAIDILGEIISELARQTREHSPFMRFVYSRISRHKFLVNMMNKQMLSLDEPHGWLIEIPESDAYWAMDIVQCGLVKYLAEQGAPEICRVFCDADYVAAEYMTGLELVRTKTLAEGDDVCDFRYFLERRQD